MASLQLVFGVAGSNKELTRLIVAQNEPVGMLRFCVTPTHNIASIKKRLSPLLGGADPSQFQLSARNVMLQDNVVLMGLQNNEAVVIHPYVQQVHSPGRCVV